MVRELRRCAFERQACDARNVARLVCRRPEGGRAVMSDEMWKGRACSGIPKNVGGSIKREHVAASTVTSFLTIFTNEERGYARRDDHPDNIQGVHWCCNGKKGSTSG